MPMQTNKQKLHRHFTDEEVKRANSVNLVELAQQYGYRLESGGRKAFHVQKSGGLYIFKQSNRFYHWATDQKGGPIDFVMKRENITYPEAVEKII